MNLKIGGSQRPIGTDRRDAVLSISGRPPDQ